MTEPYYTAFRLIHMWSDWLAFAVAPVTLAARKGGRRHRFYGRTFVLAYTLGITAGLLLAAIRDEPILPLFIFGVMTLFFLGSGYLAPRIARGAPTSYLCDRALTASGALAAAWMVTAGLKAATPAAPLTSDLTFGGLGLAVAVGHARWRGPADPARWRIEHLTSLMAAYTVSWHFVLLQYAEQVPPAARGLIPVLAAPILLWVRSRVGRAGPAPEGSAAILPRAG